MSNEQEELDESFLLNPAYWRELMAQIASIENSACEYVKAKRQLSEKHRDIAVLRRLLQMRRGQS